ncbi:MAG: hypothetical protein CSB13_01765 [Chloroflexi bacterium]|nr:MAG: hypothetical protein CSB13_01765 [Chloroflexota bacterium]
MIYMDTKANNQLITTLVTRTILKIAPYEMKLFQGQTEEYLRNPQQIIDKRGFSNQSNSNEKIIFLAPIIRSILSDVIIKLDRELGHNDYSSLSIEKSKEIYQLAYDKAIQCNLSPVKAHLVADSVLEDLLFR